MKLRDYQVEVVNQAIEKIKQYGIAYLACETRTGKTSIVLNLFNMIDPNKEIIFITKKLIKQSAENDYKEWGISNPITFISMDSLHKLSFKPNVFFAIDEAHLFGAYPKPSLRTKHLKSLVKDNIVVYLSGTPTPESYAQIYHQLWVSNMSPFKEFKTFYKWHNVFGIKAMKYIGVGLQVQDYSKVKTELIDPVISKYRISLSKADAGFKYTEVHDTLIFVKMDWITTEIMKELKKNGIYEDEFLLKGRIIADNASSMFSKHHQLCGGTVINEFGDVEIIDYSKVNYINENHKNNKIAIFYKFKGEEQILRERLKKKIAKDFVEFNNTDNNTTILYQYQSGSMGIDLSSADYIISYNIDYSGAYYYQFRDRIQSYHREKLPICEFLFTQLELEQYIYKMLLKKKEFTLSHYKKGFYNDRATVSD